MRSRTARSLTLSSVLGVAALLSMPARSPAQVAVTPAVPNGYVVPAQPHGGWGLGPRRPPIPRTYSYYYNTRFNQPRRVRVVGPDGRTRWRTTVRGLPLGTPWPGL
jgi:hypothetical protein